MTRGAAEVLEVRGVGMEFATDGAVHRVLDGIDVAVGARETVAFVGESGCGKTTLLRIMAGLQRPTAGEVRLDGRPVDGPRPDVTLVFQHYTTTLLPWRRTLDNVVLGLPHRGPEGARARESARALLDFMGLAHAVDRYPWEMSGGMQQRVALARALIRKPKVLLLDEPFSALDEDARASLESLLAALQQSDACSLVLVTHDLGNASRLADRAVLFGGRPTRVASVIDSAAGLTADALRARLSPLRR